MAETLRDLVVSLSLDSSSFSTNIKHLNALMKETDSAFKLAAAGEQNFENTLQGMGAALAAQQRTFQLQGDLITQYSGQLDEARNRLQKVVDAHEGLQSRYEASSAAVTAATAAHNELVAAMRQEEALNGRDSANMANLTAQYEASSAALTSLREQRSRDHSLLLANERSQHTYADAVTNATVRLQNAQAAHKETASAIAELQSRLSPAQQEFMRLGETIDLSKQAFTEAASNARIAQADFNQYVAENNLAAGSVEYLQARLTMLNTVLAAQGAQVEAAGMSYEALRRQFDIISSDTNSTQEQVNAQRNAMDQANLAYANAQAAMAQTANSIREVEQALSPAAQAWNAYKAAIDQANANISSSQAGVALWESYLARFAAETGASKDSVSYLAQELSTLESVINYQNNALNEYGNVLANARSQLDLLHNDENSTAAQIQSASDAVLKAETNYNKMAATVANTASRMAVIKGELSDQSKQFKALDSAIKKSEADYSSLAKQITAIQASYKALSADLQLSDSSYQGITAKLTSLGREYDLQIQQIQKYREALEATRKELELANQSGDAEKIRSASDAYYDMSAKLDSARASAAETRSAMQDLSETLGGMSEGVFNFVNGLEKFGAGCEEIGRSLYNNVTKPVLDFAKESENAFMNFESAEARLRQVTNASEDQYTSVTGAAREMSEQLGVSAESIINVMTEVGRLGIDISGNGEDFISFARTVEDMSLTLGVSAEDAGTSVARFFKLMDIQTSEISNYGSSVTYLANNYATTASEIIEMSQGLAGAGRTVGMSAQDILGISTALSSVGITAARGATTFSQALIKMETSVQTGDKYLDDFAMVAQMSSDEFVTAWKDNPTKAFMAFINGLAQMDTATSSSIGALKECGINTARLTDSLLRLKNTSGQVESAINDSNAAWETNSELESAAGKIKQTLRVKVNSLKQAFTNLKTTIGNDLAPIFGKLLDVGTSVMNWLNGMSPALRGVVETIAGVAAAIGPVLLVFGKIVPGINAVITGLSAFSAAAPAAATAATSVGTAASGIASVAGLASTGIAAIGVAAVAAAGYLLYMATGEKAVDDAARNLNNTLNDLAKNGIEGAFDRFKNGESALALFGMSKEAFIAAESESKGWLDGLIDVWTDGKAETNDIVSEWTKSFADSSDGVREAIEGQQSRLDNAGLLTPETKAKMEADKKQLDAWDKEIAELLKKRQNGLLSDEDKDRLSEVIKLRAQLEIEYGGGSADGGYADIIEKIKAEISRNLQDGVAVDPGLIGKTYAAMAEGHQAVVQAINDEYDAQFALIDQMEDGAEKDLALKKLQEERQRKLNEEAAQYKAGLLSAASVIAANSDFEDQQGNLNELLQQVQAYQQALAEGDNAGKAAAFDNIDAWLNSDKIGQLETFMETYSSLLGAGASNSEIANSFGMTEDELNSLLQTYKELKELSDGGIDGLENLGTLFSETLPNEVTEVLLGLNCDQANADWEAFIADKQTLDTDVSMSARINTIDTTVVETLKESGIELGDICTVGVKFGASWKSDLVSAYNSGTLEVFGADGAKIPVTTDLVNSITPADLISSETDENGNIKLKVVLTPELGSTEAIDLIQAALSGNPLAGSIFSFAGSSIQKDVDQIVQLSTRLDELNATKEALQNGELVPDDTTNLATVQEQIDETTSKIQQYFDLLAANPDAAGNISAQIANLIQALANPEGLSEEQIATYRNMLDVLTQFSTIAGSGNFGSTGSEVAAGVADGMQNYDFSGSAATVATSIDTALRNATQVHSPSEMTKPIGDGVAAGIGVGMSQYSFSADASKMATGIMSAIASGLSADTTASSAASAAMEAVSSAITGASTDTSSIGSNLMSGITQGINNGKSGVIQAAVQAVQEAIDRAKATAQIHSPSRVMRDEVGKMLMRGMGVGIDDEAKRTAKTMANATRYMTGTAANVAGRSTYNNQRTYNNQSTVNLNVDGLSVRDDSDVRSLAIELAQLTRRSHQSKGVLA